MSIPVTTTLNFEGYRIVQYLGVVRGIVVRAPTISQGILGGLKSIIGGQIGAYTQMCEDARGQAYELLLQHAESMGANAVVGLRYDASEVASKVGATEVLCYGTAVVSEPAEGYREPHSPRVELSPLPEAAENWESGCRIIPAFRHFLSRARRMSAPTQLRKEGLQ